MATTTNGIIKPTRKTTSETSPAPIKFYGKLDFCQPGQIHLHESSRWPESVSDFGGYGRHAYVDGIGIAFHRGQETRYATIGPWGTFLYEDTQPPRAKQPSAKQPSTKSPRATQPSATQPSAKQRRVYVPAAARECWALLRRAGEMGLLTLTQNIGEVLMLLPALECKAYVYSRALMLNEEHPGCFYISHAALAKKLGKSIDTAERVSRNLREWDLWRLIKRGFGTDPAKGRLFSRANFYAIQPLTQDRLEALRKRFAIPAPMRVLRPAPMRVPRLS
jgi:hypothetical protein